MEIKFKGTDYDYFGKFTKQLYDESRYLVLYGGAGSGKSWCAAQKILWRTLFDKCKHRFLIVRKTRPSLRKSCFALINDKIESWGLKDYFYVNRSEMILEYRPNGNQILFVGMDDQEKLKSIEHITGIWIEEPNEISERDFLQIDLRLRGKTGSYKQLILTFNPISELLWLNKHFFGKKIENCTVEHSTVEDNIFIDPEYKKILDALKDEDRMYYQIYRLGQWGVLQNIIYSNFEVIDDWPVAFEETFYGLDFGYNNPSALVEVGIRDNIPYLNERLYRTGLTNQDLINLMNELILLKTDNIYADSAEPARIDEIKRDGFNIYPADKSVKDGIDFVKRTKFYVKSDSVNLIKELQGYKYKEDKDGNVLEEPLKFRDHLCDGFRYGIFTHLGKRPSQVGSVSRWVRR